MNLVELYEKAGSNYDEVKKRLPESLIPNLLKMFINDNSINELNEAIKSKDSEKAFRAAHTLKGVSLNLGFENLSKHAINLTEKLRDLKLENYEDDYQKTIDEYNSLMTLIKQIQ